MNLKSDSARRLIHALVQEQNGKLFDSDPSSVWIIAGIDVQKEIIKQWPSQKKVIKSIEIILKTEPAPFNTYELDDDSFGPSPTRGAFKKGNSHMNQTHQNVHQNGHPGMRPERELPHQMDGREHNPVPAGVPESHGFAPVPHERGGNQHGQGNMQHVGGQGGQPHIQQTHAQGGAPQHAAGGPQVAVIPPPPPPPHGPPDGPIKHTQVVPPHFEVDQQPRSMPGGFPEPVVVPRPVPIETIDPRILKHHKSKSKGLRREYIDMYEYDSDSGMSNSDDGSQFSSRSVEDGAYGFVERSRSRGRRSSKTRSRGRSAIRSRSNGRERISKVHKTKKTHGRGRSDVEIIYEDKDKSPSKHNSPQSSASALPTQQIFNIRIDNDNDREREKKNDRGRGFQTIDHDQRRNSNHMSPPGFSIPPHAKRDKFEPHPMSRHSSVGGSETGSSIIDGNSSIYTSDDSVFSEPWLPRMHSRSTSEVGAAPHLRSRNMSIPRHDAFDPTYHESHRRQRPRYETDDYPPPRPRGSLHETETERYHSVSHQRPSMPTRRHSVQVSNPFDPRYPTQPSRSYTQASSPYAYPTGPPHQRHMPESRPDPFELRAMADQLDAMNYINNSRRNGLAHRWNGTRGRMAPEVDEWAYRPHGRVYDGYRHV